MGRFQGIAVGIAAALLVGLYLGPRTTPLNKIMPGSAQQGTAEDVVHLEAEDVIGKAKALLDSVTFAKIAGLEAKLAAANGVSKEVDALKALSSAWNTVGDFFVGGIYAEKVAQLLPSDSAWTIAGSTYGIAVNTEKDASKRAFGAKKAVEAFDNALNFDSTNVSLQINKALMLVELSRADRSVPPMQGILLLRKVGDEHPENVSAQLNLGRLSMESGQIEKALPRLEAVIALPLATRQDKLEAHYLLADAQRRLGNSSAAIEQLEKAATFAEGAIKIELQKEIDAMKKQ